MFQHTAARRRLADVRGSGKVSRGFQHTAARRRLAVAAAAIAAPPQFQHTAARRRLAGGLARWYCSNWFQHTAARRRLGAASVSPLPCTCFNTQPPEGGWIEQGRLKEEVPVSTHSRPKAAGCDWYKDNPKTYVSTHSRPKAAGGRIYEKANPGQSFNTQPPEGGWNCSLPR